MAPPKAVRATTAASLSNSLRIPSTTASLLKHLGRLSRPSLLKLVEAWLSLENVKLFPPFLKRDELESTHDSDTNPYPAAEDIHGVQEVYRELGERKGGKREVLDRILEGDWRHGVTLKQLAMADIHHLRDHPTSQKWSAFKLVPINRILPMADDPYSKEIQAQLPRIHVATFIQNLQHEISPLVKAHYHLSTLSPLPVTILRIFVTDSPYQKPRHSYEVFLDASRIIYVAFPDSCPFLYTSMSLPPAGPKSANRPSGNPLTNDHRTLQQIVREAIPKALSRPQARFALKSTSLTAKSLHSLVSLRGPGRTNEANGAFSIFADAVAEGAPIDPRLPKTVSLDGYQLADLTGPGKENGSHSDEKPIELPDPRKRPQSTVQQGSRSETVDSKRRKLAVARRFGTSGTDNSAFVLDRLDIRLLDRPAGDSSDNPLNPEQPTLSLTFHGTDVIGGLRRLAETGIIDPTRMPSWMTGEDGVSRGAVRNGKIITPEAISP
jgi:central kinetochore subunit Mis15/CHL4